MFIGSHSLIGSFIYKSVLTKSQPRALRYKYLFKWGNVLPDLHHELSQVNHYIEFTLNYVGIHEKIIQDPSISSQQRFISLGIVCHFLSDYFCTYHALAPYKERSILQHLAYEIALHVRLRYCLLFPNKLLKKLSIRDDIKYCDIRTIVLSLQRDYFRQKTSIMNDIVFALRATSMATAHLLKTPVSPLENEESIDMVVA